MKKRNFMLITMLIAAGISVFLLSGCTKEAEKNSADSAQETLDEGKTELSQSQTEPDQTGSESQEDTKEETQSRTVALYYVDADTAEIVSKSIEIKDEQDIWNALKGESILTEDCELISLTVNQASRTMDLDFNSATGERIRGMGTTGETEIIACIVNTYLEAYDCEGIRMTEEGAPLQTSSGANFDGYSGKISL